MATGLDFIRVLIHNKDKLLNPNDKIDSEGRK